ncbi:RDD family protein [Flavobacterium sp. I3-2]|uniref:RDD family protein n=1 Tax=Flavobacterium sp. I3-2 TaxID=2748319 RepID=UPI0015A92A20|nr:RDD family protein [Flavobacterium sp. I3-2]
MLIIFGTKNISSTFKRGHFDCPRCNTQRIYNLNKNRQFFSLFFVPIIPLQNNGDTLTCSICKTDFFPNTILSSDEYISTTKDIDDLDFAIASPGKRLFAFVLDLIFLIILNFPLAYLANYLPKYFDNKFVLVFLTVWIFYFFIMEVLFKGTIGKKIIGIETITETENKSISVTQNLIRSIVKIIPFINMALLFNNKKKGCHDFIAKTIVKEK